MDTQTQAATKNTGIFVPSSRLRLDTSIGGVIDLGDPAAVNTRKKPETDEKGTLFALVNFV
jgi:hypothetical protein